MTTKLSGLLIALAILAGVHRAAAQGTAFSYQGQLSVNGVPANGSYDLTFAIFDSAAAENQVGVTLTNLATPVAGGVFFATLDFGPEVFTGPPRWLEVGVRSNGTGNFTALVPLQLVTAAPYAVMANSASNLMGVLPVSQLPSSVITNNSSNLNISGNFSGNGGGLTNTPGTLAWQTPSNVTVQAQSNTGYVLTNSQVTTLTLPASPNVGDIVKVAGITSGGWIIAQNAGQSVSGNFTPVWTTTSAPLGLWQAIASSSDGTHLVAGMDSGDIYVSTNAGGTWQLTSADLGLTYPYSYLYCLTTSANGTNMAAAVYSIDAANTPYGGGIFISSDSGNTWQQSGAPTEGWTAIASSSDGTILYGTSDELYISGLAGIYQSTDSGATWQQTTAPVHVEWFAVACSSDGTHVVAGGYAQTGPGIFTSSDSGATWQPTTMPENNYYSIASSADGSHLAVVNNQGYIYTSTNFGANWVQTTAPIEQWHAIASSSDGTHLVATGYSCGIYTSINGGATWELSTAPVGLWTSVAISSDGSHIAATGYSSGSYTGGIYTCNQASATTVGTGGFLQGAVGSTIELLYIGGGNFVAVSQIGTIYLH